MKASELIAILQDEIQEQGDFNVGIRTSDPSYGAAHIVEIEHAGFGIDWECNAFSLTPSEHLYTASNAR
jgi:hypothetical protein